MGLSRLWSNSQEAIDFSKLYVSFLLKSVPEPQQTSLKSPSVLETILIDLEDKTVASVREEHRKK
jgi:hypothetical protein